MISQQDIIAQVVEALPGSAHNDLPMIRQALNDLIYQHKRAGELDCFRSDSWSQKNMVRRVQLGLLRKWL